MPVGVQALHQVDRAALPWPLPGVDAPASTDFSDDEAWLAAQWQADPAGLRRRSVDLLDAQRLVRKVEGGVLVLPALARYRGVVVTVREREPQLDLSTELVNSDSSDPEE